MKVLKKFWLWFLALLPMSSWGVAPLVLGGAAVGVGIIGVSIWRTVAPVNIQEALDFFTSCWTCQIFSDIMISMSNLLPKVWSALSHVIIPMSATLLAIFIAWNLLYGTLNNKVESVSKIMGNFGTHIFRLGILIALLLVPLPRFITDVLVEPALVIGTSFDYLVSDNNKFSECMVATALADPVSVSSEASAYGAFSPKIRHQLACEVANVHQVTGLGMTIGWTMMNMAFDVDYMHKILMGIPIFPNIPILFGGLLVFVLYFFALLPIPLYFLEIFVKLSMDLIMLPLMLMSWMFDDENFALFPKGGRTIRQMIDDVIKAIVGIALTIVFLGFSILFLNAVFGGWKDVNILQQAIANNDSKMLMDSLVFQDYNIITVILMGVFIAMFMTMIPQLTSMLFKIQISDKYYQTAKKDLNILWDAFNRFVLGKKTKTSSDNNASSGSGGGGGGVFGNTNQNSSKNYTLVEYIESTGGTQYIDTGFKPDSNTSVKAKVQIVGDTEAFLFGAKEGLNSFAFGVVHNGNPSNVYVEYGSFSDSADVGYSLRNKTIQINMNLTKTRTRILDESDREILSIPHPTLTFGKLYNMYLFALDDQGLVSSRATCRIYSLLIFDDNQLIRSFIPVLDSNQVPCLYDIVGGQFYYNEGSVPFVAGPKV